MTKCKCTVFFRQPPSGPTAQDRLVPTQALLLSGPPTVESIPHLHQRHWLSPRLQEKAQDTLVPGVQRYLGMIGWTWCFLQDHNDSYWETCCSCWLVVTDCCTCCDFYFYFYCCLLFYRYTCRVLLWFFHLPLFWLFTIFASCFGYLQCFWGYLVVVISDLCTL